MHEKLKQYIEAYENNIAKYGVSRGIVDAYYKAVFWAVKEGIDRKTVLNVSKRAKEVIEEYFLCHIRRTIWDVERQCQEENAGFDLLDMYYELIKQESYDLFESFVYYMERNRPWQKRFYQPRQKTLHVVAQDLQDLEDGKIRFLGVSLPSRTGKSTLNILFLSWIAMKRPNSHNAMGGHSGILAKGFHKELLNFMTTEEYTFAELFSFWHPGAVIVRDKSADEFTITLDKPDRFATITCRGIDGTWTGAVDVSADGYLYVDDLVRDREHSLSPIRMENTFQEYLNKMVDRKNDGARELMVGTLWNILDPLERMRKQYENDPDYRFRKIPALNENDESNFDYEINGFSTEYYREMREKLEEPEWMAKFQQQPFVREGLLFPKNELQYLDREILDGENTVMAVCDPAFGGADNTSMPVCMTEAETGKKIIIDWMYKKGTQAATVPRVVDRIEKHYITELHIEQNSGGKLYTDSIKEEMKRRGVYFCRIIPYYASVKIPKEERIKANSDWVKSNLTFLMDNRYADNMARYKRSDEYQAAMNEMHMHTSEGKNKNDDAADSITKLAEITEKKRKPTKIMHGFL